MPTLGPSAIAGACAGLVSSIVTCPLDVVKTKLQAQSSARPPASGAKVTSGGSVASASSSGTATAAVRPRLVEAEGDRVYRGLLGTLRTIYKDDGIRGFYRGLGPTVFGYLPTWAIYFTVYDGCKEFLANNAGNGEEAFINHIASAMMAGAASTVCTSPLWVVKTRFMLQSTKPRDPSHPPPYKHTLDAFIRIMQNEGPLGFYRGLLPSLMGVTHVAVQFPLYETFKSWAREASDSNGEGGLGGAELSPRVILACSSSAKMIASVLTYPHEVVRTRLQMHPQTREKPAASTAGKNQGKKSIQSSTATAASDARRGYATSGGAAPITLESRRHYAHTTASSPAITRPPSPLLSSQSLRTRLQSTAITTISSSYSSSSSSSSSSSDGGPSQKYTSLLRTVRTIFQEEGLRGFYNGMGVNLVRTVPSSALTILTYELMMQHLNSGGGKNDGEVGNEGTREER